MKSRKRKKFSWSMCSHNKSRIFVVTDVPYTMYDSEFICSLKGIREMDRYKDAYPCEKCKHFTISKHEFANEYQRRKEIRRMFKNGGEK